MKFLKASLLSFLFVLIGATVFASPDSYIKIVTPEDGYDMYVYNDGIDEFKYTFNGEVSSDCVSIRVLWSRISLKHLEEYLVRGGKKNPGDSTFIDDFVLKQYVSGSTSFVYNVSGKFENLAYGSNFYKFVATYRDGATKICDFICYVHNGGMAERAKPVIYLYPEKTQEINVKVEPAGGVTESIPDYNDGWTVSATPESKITDLRGDKSKTYPYLFWESKDNGAEIDMSEGFVVETKKLQSFFEEKLALLGLNKNEISDFTEYWVPELQGKKYVFITFYSQKRIDEEAPLTVSPKPDTVIRVYFDHKKLDKKIKVKPQELSATERKGFTVVEWGGKRYK